MHAPLYPRPPSHTSIQHHNAATQACNTIHAARQAHSCGTHVGMQHYICAHMHEQHAGIYTQMPILRSIGKHTCTHMDTCTHTYTPCSGLKPPQVGSAWDPGRRNRICVCICVCIHVLINSQPYPAPCIGQALNSFPPPATCLFQSPGMHASAPPAQGARDSLLGSGTWWVGESTPTDTRSFLPTTSPID